MKKIITLTFALLPVVAFTQEQPEREAVLNVIRAVFDGMRTGDSASMRPLFHPDIRMQTTYIDEEGNPKMVEGSLDRWLDGVGQPKEEAWDEKIWSYDVQIDQNLATVWTDYTFYLGDKLSHCGVNAFQLFKDEDGWKIFQITDTRSKENCQTPADDPLNALNDVVDNWHIAAAMADEEAFFGAMTPDAVYIGTDASERWKREELRAWAKEFFAGESAWEFKPSGRHITIDSNGRTAWWDEVLETKMGVCRGSGILVKTPEGWKIQHYHLSVTLPNEKMPDFLDLIKE